MNDVQKARKQAYYAANAERFRAKRRARYYAEKEVDISLICEVKDCWHPWINNQTRLCKRHQTVFIKLLANSEVFTGCA